MQQVDKAAAYYNDARGERDWDQGRLGREAMPDEAAVVRQWIGTFSQGTRPPRHVVEIGCGKGALRTVDRRYVGLDFSIVGLSRFGGRRVQANAESLPFRSRSVDLLFSFAVIEHVPHPERAFEEIARVLASSGIAILWPAWFCRDWAAKGLPVRRYRELSLRDRIAKALIPIRNNLVWRSAAVFPLRLIRELQFLWRTGPRPFAYRRLAPNLDEYIYTDCDAFTSMDPHAAVLFFLSRGLRVMGRETFMQRLRVRNEPIVVSRD